MKKSVSFVVVTYVLSLVLLSGCGRKNEVSPPTGKEYSFPKSYPRK